MEAYTSFARVYDMFMDNVPYEVWGRYIVEKLRANGIDSGYVVDLGCGTGKLTTLLADAGYDMIGIDNSFDMLDMALEREDDRILYLMQDMREFEPGEKVSAVVSACDSINYILEPEDLQAVFFCVSESLKEGGIFIFDINTPYKYEVLMADNTIAENRNEGKGTYTQFVNKLSKDLSWDSKGLSDTITGCYLNEPEYHLKTTIFMFVFYFGTLIYAVISLIFYILCIRFPVLAPACQNLVVFGNPHKLLAEAEEELATLPQLATEDMFITEHYFIMTSPYGNAIVPIKEILWIYKYSTLHKILWYHFSISYTLHISANKHLYIHCPKNTKSDIDGIIDYLAEANHDILVGFSEENRLKVQAIQGKPLHVERLLAWKKK